MQCSRCGGLVLERYGQWTCCNCGHDPFLKLITVKCSNPDCFALPELNGYCTPCWHSRKRSTLTEAQKAKMYREKQRRANAAKRAKRAQLKEATSEQSDTAQQSVCGVVGVSGGDCRAVEPMGQSAPGSLRIHRPAVPEGRLLSDCDPGHEYGEHEQPHCKDQNAACVMEMDHVGQSPGSVGLGVAR